MQENIKANKAFEERCVIFASKCQNIIGQILQGVPSNKAIASQITCKK